MLSINAKQNTTASLVVLCLTTAAKASNFTAAMLISVSVILLSACQSGSANLNNPSVQPDSQNTASAAELPVTADLSADSLVPPAQIEISISSSQGLITLEWEAIENQRSSNVYLYDSLVGSEIQIASIDDSGQNTYTLPSMSHQRAWHREFLRVEVCTTENCISSKRLSVADAIESSIQRITPSVFIQGERFAQSLTVNDNAKLMAVALPTQGAIDFYLRPANSWVATQRTNLANLSVSSVREIHMDFSSSGDTLAVLILHNNTLDTPEIKILERLGEGWFETNTMVLSGIERTFGDTKAVELERPIIISDNGSRMLVNIEHQAYTLYQTDIGWSAPELLTHTGITSWPDTFTDRVINDGVLKSMSASRSLDRIFLAHSIDQSLWLSTWQVQPTSISDPTWEKTAAYPINAIATDNELKMSSNRTGDNIIIAGWESLDNTDRTPVAWRYQLPDSSAASVGTSLNSLDSIRFPPTQDPTASIRFSSNDELNQVVLGWQGMAADSNGHDAALMTYTYSSESMRWIPKLELPEVYPTFAKQAFVRSTELSHDGSALMISISAGNSLSSENRVGEIVSFH